MIYLCYNDKCKNLLDVVKELSDEVTAYNEDFYKEKKLSYKVKGKYGARLTPFCVFEEQGKVKAFYSEIYECTEENIREYWNRRCNSIGATEASA